MTYKEFEEKIKERLENDFGEETVIKSTTVTKNNGVLRNGLTAIRSKNVLNPTIYLDDYYNDYENGESLSEVYYKIRVVFEKSFTNEGFDISVFDDYTKAEPKIYMKLVDSERNRLMLEDTPHIDFLDLAVIFYLRVDVCQNAGGTLIRDFMMERWNISIDELFRAGMDNFKASGGSNIFSMRDYFMDLCQKGCMSIENIEDVERQTDEMFSEDFQMFIGTNASMMYGAVCMLDNDALAECADELDENLFILPSSIHEVIICPDNGATDADDYRRMVNEVNGQVVGEVDILSDSVYYFDRIEKRLSLA